MARVAEFIDLTGEDDDDLALPALPQAPLPPPEPVPTLRRIVINPDVLTISSTSEGSHPRRASTSTSTRVASQAPARGNAAVGAAPGPSTSDANPHALSAKSLGKQKATGSNSIDLWRDAIPPPAKPVQQTSPVEVITLCDTDSEDETPDRAGPSTPRDPPSPGRPFPPPRPPSHDPSPDSPPAESPASKKSSYPARKRTNGRACKLPPPKVQGPESGAGNDKSESVKGKRRAVSPLSGGVVKKTIWGAMAPSEKGGRSAREPVQRTVEFATGLVIPGDNDPPDLVNVVKQHLVDQSRKRPHERSLTGPTLPGEFLSPHYAELQRLARHAPSHPSHAALFQAVLDDVHSREFNSRQFPLPQMVRLCPPPPSSSPTGPFSPPLDLYYTNRAIYPDGVVPLPPPNGCDCKGRCDDPMYGSKCVCRKRQEAACRTRERRGREARAPNKGFAFGPPEGTLVWVEEDPTRLNPIFQCGDGCGCPPGCVNRTAASGPTVPVDIVWTGNRGWGVRTRPAEDGGRVVKKGTPIGIYAGELLQNAAVKERERTAKERGEVYRNYLYDLDYWHAQEDLKDSRLPPHPPKSKLSRPRLVRAQSSARRSREVSDTPSGGEPEAETDDEEDDFFNDLEWTVDAQNFGNFTRYCNHCCIPNAAARAVYIDDTLITRPLHLFIAIRDIEPGEEITISYSSEDARLQPGESLVAYQKKAAQRRKDSPEHERCLCGLDLCRGVMFTT